VDKETVDRVRKEAEESWTKMSLLKDAYFKAESDYIKKLNRFRNFDYELAQTDGRLTKIPSRQERKPKKQPELTLEQLKSIAATLGVNITVEEPEEEAENIAEECETMMGNVEETKSDEELLKDWEEVEKNETKV
jgi:hypothetical protein